MKARRVLLIVTTLLAVMTIVLAGLFITGKLWTPQPDIYQIDSVRNFGRVATAIRLYEQDNRVFPRSLYAADLRGYLESTSGEVDQIEYSLSRSDNAENFLLSAEFQYRRRSILPILPGTTDWVHCEAMKDHTIATWQSSSAK